MLLLENIYKQFLEQCPINKDWDIIVSKEKGHEKGDIHDHYHVYLKYTGKNKSGFSCKGKNACRVFDIPLLDDVVKFRNGYVTFDYSINNCKDSEALKNFEKVKNAHPNIKFKGDKNDKNCKNTKKMIEYVTKVARQPEYRIEKNKIDIISNFDWENKLIELNNNIDVSKNKFNKQQQMEFEFTSFLRDCINKGYTESTLYDEIKKNDNYNYIYE